MGKKAKVIQVTAIDSTMDKLIRRLNEISIDEGYDVICVCSNGEIVEKLRNEGFKVNTINIDRKINPLSNIKSVYNMYKFFKAEKPDIVHVHTPVAAVLGRIAAKLAKVPNIIYTAHGFYFHENMKPIVYKIFLTIEKIMAKYFTDFIFTQNAEDAKTAVDNRFIKENKVIAIGNGVDIYGKFNPKNIVNKEIENLYKELGISSDDKVVSFIGRLVKEKGILDLLDSYKDINHENIKFIITGDVLKGERDTETVNLLEEYKSNKNIIFTGKRSDVHNILYISDIFCLPSYREGMPRSIIEAMAMECAVVATNIRGSREEVVDGETGKLVSLNSPKEIADSINEILENEIVMKNMKLNGRKRAEKLYDEDVVVSKQLNIFEQLLNDREFTGEVSI